MSTGKILEKLLEVVDKNDALLKASEKGKLGVVKLLLAIGANVNAREKSGATPLHLASANGHKAIVRILITEGANVNARDIYGNTSLHLAAANSHEGMVEVLRKNGGTE